MQTKINISQITSIEIHLNRKSYYKYRPTGKWLWISYPEMLISTIFGDMTIQQLEKSNTFFLGEDKIVYHKPHIKIRVSDGTWHVEYFKDKDQLDRFILHQQLENIKWLNL